MGKAAPEDGLVSRDVVGLALRPQSEGEAMDVTVLAMLSVLSGAPQMEPPLQRVAESCFFQYEQPSGLNKMCFYNCASGGYAITVKGYALCPITIHR